jgi:pSer/pThr/pTyr-binding forkhead associated (FHA) protein
VPLQRGFRNSAAADAPRPLAAHQEPRTALALGGDAADPIPLIGIDLTFGRDAALASVVLDDASISGLHARLIRQADGGYVLKDQGSTGGTYVNFSPVPEAGSRLQHGDRVHVGRLSFRFRLADPPPPRPIRVTSATETGFPPKEPRA